MKMKQKKLPGSLVVKNIFQAFFLYKGMIYMKKGDTTRALNYFYEGIRSGQHRIILMDW